jgi:ubiquinone/menaquinone biosynthesis C-methylase UbiE
MRPSLGQRLARVATNAVVAKPQLWRLFRGPIRRQFEQLAANWDSIRSPGHLAAYERALARLPEPPKRALDLGTGTGDGAFTIATHFPEADVVGVDLAPGMLAEARRKTPAAMADRVRFEEGDAAHLPYPDRSFDLVAHANMIPFFAELARIVAPGGSVLFAFSVGAQTPIYVPPARLREELGKRGFGDFVEVEAGPATALIARKP